MLSAHFSDVQHGLQGDSWIWILDSDVKVAVDTFSSMKHQVKSKKSGAHIQRVIAVLGYKFELRVYQTPELEGWEDV